MVSDVGAVDRRAFVAPSRHCRSSRTCSGSSSSAPPSPPFAATVAATAAAAASPIPSSVAAKMGPPIVCLSNLQVTLTEEGSEVIKKGRKE